MPRRIREYHRPADLDSAAKLLRRSGIRTAPLTVGPRPTAIVDRVEEAAVDLGQAGLAYIRETDDRMIHIGAATPLQDLVESELLRSQANGMLAEAAYLSAHPGLRHLASLGGLLSSSDGPPELLLALLAFDATIVLRGQRQREAALADLLSGGMRADELAVEAKFARLPSAGGGALERVARTPRDQAIVAAAAVVELDGDVCQRVRLAVAGAGPVQRMASAEKLLAGQPLTDERIGAAARAVEAAVNPASDFLGSAEYRRAMAGVLAHRALVTAWKRVRNAERNG